VAELARRREKDRERKPAKHPRIPRISTDSVDSMEFQPGSLSPVPSPRPSPLTPSLSSHSPTAGARETDDATEAALREALLQCPAEFWPSVDEFLKRRPYRTWKAWVKEFLTQSVHAGWPKVSSVCSDDGALERPIGSPAGFRTFIATAKREGLAVVSPATSRGGARNDAAIDGWLEERERQKVANGH
jgi:hypothetical protein